MKLLTALLTLAVVSTIASPAFAQRAIEGLDQETYDNNTKVLLEGRMKQGYQRHHDFYYDSKKSEQSSYDTDECDAYVNEAVCVEMSTYDDDTNVIINGAF